jgi:RNA ligase
MEILEKMVSDDLKQFEAFPKIARLNRECVITEKIDGTNAQIIVTPEGEVLAGSRTRLITPENDNFGFARWVEQNKESLKRLGYGRHFGEWWGTGIQRTYSLSEKRFSLFNVHAWKDGLPEGLPSNVGVVPILYQGIFSSQAVKDALWKLESEGSTAAPGFLNAEGIVLYHTASKSLYKVTLVGDEKPKGSKE